MFACTNLENMETEINNDNNTSYNAYDDLAEITEGDFETIDYVNEHSFFGSVKFMKKLGDDVDVVPTSPGESAYCEISNVGLVTAYGKYIPELQGKYLSIIEINNNDEKSDILGVRNKDKYGDAVKKLEEQGFEFCLDIPNYSVMYKKGRVAVEFNYFPYTNNYGDKNECEIGNLTVKFLYVVPKSSEDYGDP